MSEYKRLLDIAREYGEVRVSVDRLASGDKLRVDIPFRLFGITMDLDGARFDNALQRVKHLLNKAKEGQK